MITTTQVNSETTLTNEQSKLENNKLVLGKGTYGEIQVWQQCPKYVVKTYPFYEDGDKFINSVAVRELLFSRYSLNHPAVSNSFQIGHNYSSFTMHMENRGVSLKSWVQSVNEKSKLNASTTLDVAEKISEEYKNVVWKNLPQIFFKIACAVQHLHQQNTIHADLKLENILIKSLNHNNNDNNEFQITVIDFGAVVFNRFIHSQSLGTRSYTAPESFVHPDKIKEIYCDSAIFHFSNDIFSIGTLFLELILNEYPFFKKSANDERYIYSVYETNQAVQFKESEQKILHEFSSNGLEFELIVELIPKMLQKNFLHRPICSEIINLFVNLSTESLPPKSTTIFNFELEKSFNDKFCIDAVNNHFGHLLSPKILPNYIFVIQKLQTWHFRKLVIYHLYEFCLKFECLPIFSLSVYLFDQYLSIRRVDVVHWYELSLVCLVVANDVSEYLHMDIITVAKYIYRNQKTLKLDKDVTENNQKVQNNGVNNTTKSRITLHMQKQLMKKLYLKILEDSNFHLYFEMFDLKLLQLRDNLGYQRLLTSANSPFGRLYIPDNGLYDTLVDKSSSSNNNTNTINYFLVYQICNNEQLFLKSTTSQLLELYLRLESNFQQKSTSNFQLETQEIQKIPLTKPPTLNSIEIHPSMTSTIVNPQSLPNNELNSNLLTMEIVNKSKTRLDLPYNLLNEQRSKIK